MNAIKLSLCAAVATAAMAFAGTASAADGPTVTYNVGAATDYVFRGLDQTSFISEGEIFGGADVTVSQFYAGAWLSTTGVSGQNGFEYDLYAGWKPSVGPVALDLGVIYYGYTKDNGVGLVTPANATTEWKAAASIPVGGLTLGGAVYYADELGSTNESSIYYEANAAYTFANKATLSGAIGSFQSDALITAVGEPDSYLTWNVGVSYPVTEKVGLDVRYISTDSDARNSGFTSAAAFSGAVATLKLSF
jgi:uncharacterized protein (TIGR02001 family)